MDDSVALDPSVELFNTGKDSSWALCHPLLCTGMLVPRGEGMAELLRSLTRPRSVADLVREYEDEQLVRTIVGALLERGFAHRADEDAAASRERVRLRPGPCDTLRVDLDRGEVTGWVPGVAVSLELSCSRLSDHAGTFARLADLRREGTLLVHSATVLAASAEAGDDVLGHLFRLGAELEIAGLPWPHPREVPPPVAAALAARLQVGLRLRVAERDLTPAAVDACAGWAEQQRLNHITLSLAEPVRPELLGECLEQLEARLCDVRVAELPSDPVIVGYARAPARAEDSPLLRAHLKRRMAYIQSLEGRMTWAQLPAGEDFTIPPDTDLLPNRPDLLGLRPGMVLAEICGGIGRGARRLWRHLSPGGTLLCFDKEELFVDMGRRFAARTACEGVHSYRALAQRTPLPDASVDAVVMEWAGLLILGGMGKEAVREMARVLRPGGRLALSVRICLLNFDAMDQPPVMPTPNTYRDVQAAMEQAPLRRVQTLAWAFSQRLHHQLRLWFAERYLPRLIEPLAGQRYPEFQASADVNVTHIYEKR